jgi:hypothetical protein
MALQDLTAYKKFREKEVSSAARGIIGLFRCAARCTGLAPIQLRHGYENSLM